jgi:hypothetical protein
MKKMFKLLMCAAVITAGFTACSEEVTPIPVGGEGGTERGILTINFKNPTTYAADDKAKDSECTVKNVTIFLFNSAGVCKVNTTLDANQLTPGTAANVNEYEAQIDVPLGLHTVFAGVNLTTGTDKMLETMGTAYGFDKFVNLGTVNVPSLAAIKELSADNAFTMFSDNAKTINIVPTPAGGSVKNEVTLSLNRMVAKVTARKIATFATDQANLKADGATFNADSVKWTVGNLNAKIYPYGNANNGNRQDPNYDFAGPLKGTTGADYMSNNFINDFVTTAPDYAAWDVATFESVDISTADINTRKSKYVPENNSLQKRKGESSFMVVKAKFAPDKTYTFDKDADSAPKEVASSGGDFTTNLTYHVVRYTQTFYFADANKAMADAYVKYLTDVQGQQGIKVETFYGQYCFYQIFMGKSITTRNNYYDITLNKFTGLGNPKGEIDEEDVDQTDDNEAKLDVTILINPWSYVTENHNLGK